MRLLLSILLALLVCNVMPAQEADMALSGLRMVSDGTIVGKIADELSVTPTGQLTYEIPIRIPTGTGGMEPKLAIVYNGSTRNGLCGVGFDLQGLSVVSRAPANLHVDGSVGVMSLNSHDKFMLDGQRLILVNTAYPDRMEFRTENNGFSRICCEANDGGPSRFTANTKSGLFYEYNTVLPVQKWFTASDGQYPVHLLWPVTKVSDTSGNYYTVTYDTNPNFNEYWPTRIDYTGNAQAGTAPYASVRFEYSLNSDSTSSYAGGLKIGHTHILNAIKVYHGETLVKTYALAYEYIDGRNHLSSVEESAPDGTKLRPTTFTWYRQDDSEYDYERNYSEMLRRAEVTTGDFNGDGISDIVLRPATPLVGWSGIRLFTGDGETMIYQGTTSLRVSGEIGQMVSGDFNGDGRDDIVIYRTPSNNDYRNCDLYLSQQNGNSTHFVFHSCFLVRTEGYTIHRVEVNGDGIADLLVTDTDSRDGMVISSSSAGGIVQPLHNQTHFQSSEKWGDVQIGDFNGDGLSDILNRKSSIRVLRSLGNGTFSQMASDITTDSHYHSHYVGDFNGDGKSDVMVFRKNGSAVSEKIWFSDGWGFDPIDLGTGMPIANRQPIVADVNGDGRDDLYMVLRDGESNHLEAGVLSYLNMRNGRLFINSYDQVNTYALNLWNYNLGDFNGDGRLDLLCTAKWGSTDWNGCWLFYAPGRFHGLLQSVTDGMGNTTTVDYANMTNDSVYTHDADAFAYPVQAFCNSWPVVRRVTVPDGIGGTSSTTYHYHNALLHKRGRGLLGFERVETTDEATGTVSTTLYEPDPSQFVMGVRRETTEVDHRLVQQTDYTNALCTYDNMHVFSYEPAASVTRRWEFNTGELIYSDSILTERDTYGNVTFRKSWCNGKTVTNVNTYANDTVNWLLGRLTRSVVTYANDNDTIVRTSAFGYDPATGLLAWEAVEPEDSLLGHRKTYARDSFGNIILSRTIPNDNTQTPRTVMSEYDEHGRFLTVATDAMGEETITTYDTMLGLPLTVTDPNGFTTVRTYDGLGNLLSTATPIDTVTVTMAWVTGSGMISHTVTTRQTGKPLVCDNYDALSRKLRTQVYAGLTSGYPIFTDVVYDHKGRVQKTSEPYYAGASTVFWNENEYDAMGRVIRQTAPDGSHFDFAYDGLDTYATDPLGRTTIKTVDMEGHLLQSEDAAGGMVTYEYDVAGRCVTVTGPRTVTHTEYDRLGRRTRLVDPDLGTVTYSYNGFGEVAEQVHNGKWVRFTYDGLGRVATESRRDMTVTNTWDTRWVGALTKAHASNGVSVEYTYDAWGRETQRKHSVLGKQLTFSTSYTDRNQVATITYPSGLQVRNVYSSNSHLLVKVVDTATGKTYWKGNATDARGQLESVTLGNGLQVLTTHDAARGTVDRIHTTGITDWSYSFNEVGNLTCRTDNLRQLEETFAYDNRDRLVSVMRNDTLTQRMTYDAAGNLTFKTGVGDNFTYQPGTNRLISVRGAGYNPRPWDAVSYTSYMKVKAIHRGDESLTFWYGPDKRRALAEWDDGDSIRYRYYAGQLYELADEPGRGAVQKNYIFATGGMVALVETQNGNRLRELYLHKDHLGSVIAYSDSTGALVQELSYDAWGRRRNPVTWQPLADPSGAEAIDVHGFTGHEHIDLFDLVNMDGRIYDPVLGRFLSPDPVVQAPDLTQGLNRYTYCMNNPLSLVDPSGYSWFSRHWKSLFSAVVGIVAGCLTGGIGSGVVSAIIGGAIGGASSALVGSILNGANLWQTVKATLTGGFFGGMSGFLNYASGGGMFLERMFKHMVSEAVMSGLQGGNILHGAMMGALAAGQGQVLGRYGGRMRTGARLAVVAVVGGTVAELGGGKFANGAMTAAFAFLFNDNSHDKNNDNELAAEERLQLEIGEYAKSFVGDLAPNGDSYCNHFVKYILTHFGVYPNGNDLLAKDWANRDIPNWKIVTDGSFRNGDVAAFAWQMTDATGHCGIVYNVMINNQLIPHLIYVTYNSANVKMNKLSVFRLGSNNKKPNWIIRRYSK